MNKEDRKYMYGIFKRFKKKYPKLTFKEFEKEMEKNLLEPEPDEYTEFDPARHSDVKGTLPPRMVKYGIHSIYRI